MDFQDKSEARATYRNVRQTSGGKGDQFRKLDMDKASIWCDHGRFRDKCEVCNEPQV